MGDDVRREAERDADRLRRITANVGVPVEPAGIADRLGVQVLEAKLKEEAFGGLLLEPGKDPKIVLNERHGLVRRRLTCALEIGRYIRRPAEIERYAHVDRQGDLSGSVASSEDEYAGEFAACLLMPKVAVKALMEIGMDDLEMALSFVVSREAVRLRLSHLDLRAVDRRAA